MNNTNSTYSTNIHPTIQGNYPWWILEGLPHISTEATAQGFDAYLTPNFPQRPPDLAPGSADRDIKYRQDIQRDYDTRIGRFIATVKAMTEKSAYKSGVTGFLTQKNPIAALQYIETSLIRESGLSSAKEIMDKFFDTYSKSGKFPNQGPLIDVIFQLRVVCIGVKFEYKRLHLTHERLVQFPYRQFSLDLVNDTFIFKNILETYLHISYINFGIFKSWFHGAILPFSYRSTRILNGVLPVSP